MLVNRINCIHCMQWLLCFEWNQIFTDAGQYVIRFGSADPSSKTGLASVVKHSTKIEVSSFLILLILMFFFVLILGRFKNWKLLDHWPCQRELWLLHWLSLWIMIISQGMVAGKLGCSFQHIHFDAVLRFYMW